MRTRSSGGVLVALLFVVSLDADAVTRHVPSQYATIAAGLSAAVSGDTVLVACGTYAEHGLVMTSGAVLRSETGDPSCATIDAGGIGRVMLCQGVSSATRIEGITFSGGSVSGYSPSQFGAGILCIDGANPVISNCTFTNNTTTLGQGGGLACAYSSPIVENCSFHDNVASSAGGVDFAAGAGAACLQSSANFQNCVFENNSGFDGAALYSAESPIIIESCQFRNNVAENWCGGVMLLAGDVYGEATISNCLFEGNEAEQVGAIFCFQRASPSITNCMIRRNSAQDCGGLGCGSNSNALVSNVVFVENTSNGNGGGLSVGSSSDARFVNCLFLRNTGSSGGAVSVGTGAEPVFESCTFVDNACTFRASFLRVLDASPTFNRCIVANNPPGDLIWCRSISGEPFQPIFACTNIFGNASGDWSWECIADQAERDGNLSADPEFCDPASDDYTLNAGSPCLPGHHPGGWDCGQIGAFGRGCGTTATEATTWGRLKGQFRR